MKKIVALFCLVVCFSCMNFAGAQTTQYLNLYLTNGTPQASGGAFLSLQTNQVVSVVGGSSPIPSLGGLVPGGYFLNLPPLSFTNGTATQVFTGLTNISISGYSGQYAIIKIVTPATRCLVSNYIPADAVVIPTNTVGNIQIILESSVDLVNWTAANPGIYSAASSTNRFFRVRAAVLP